MKDIEKYNPHTTQVYLKDNIEMRGRHYDSNYEVYVFLSGTFKAKISYHGEYDKAQVNTCCAALLAHLSK